MKGLLATLTLLLLLGCGPKPGPPEHVVVFLIDTLRADHLGSYGGPSGATPHLDALGAESVVFEAANAPAPWTLPSVTSLMTSTFPCEHGVLVDGDRLPDSITPLAERLRSVGFRTVNLYANPYAGEMSGLDRGFDLHRQGLDAGARAVERALDRPQEGETTSRLFLYVHNTGPHDPYLETQLHSEVEIPLEERKTINRQLQTLRRLSRADFTAERPIGSVDNSEVQRKVMANLREKKAKVRALYEQDVARADARLGQVIAVLEQRGLLEKTVFILVSDHGEEFDEHGGWQHDQSVYEELLHVPLMIRLPNARFAGRRVQEAVSLVDLVPTLASLLEQPGLAENSRGRSLLPLIEGDSSSDVVRVTGMRDNRKKFFRPFHEIRGEVQVVARKGEWKSIWNVETGTIELYDLSADPQERTDLALERSEIAAELRAASERWQAACQPAPRRTEASPDLDLEALERLRALGYAD